MKYTDIFEKIEQQWKHVAYDPKKDRIYLLTDVYRCLDTRADWLDCQYQLETRVLINNRRIRYSKVKKMIYLGAK